MTYHPSRLKPETRQRIIDAQEPVSPEADRKGKIAAAVSLIKMGGEWNCPGTVERGWSLLTKLLIKNLELSAEELSLLAKIKEKYIKQIEEVNDGKAVKLLD